MATVLSLGRRGFTKASILSKLSIRQYSVISNNSFDPEKKTTTIRRIQQCRHNGSSSTSGGGESSSINKIVEREPVPVKILNNGKDGCTPIQMADALRPNFVSQTPVVLRSSPLSNCDAIKCWRSLQYLRLAVGETTTCEVEIGKSYNDANSMRPEIPFSSYIDYLEQFAIEQQNQKQGETNSEFVYLAQNDLNLFPIIGDDIPIPDLCNDATFDVGEGKLYQTMLWIGPIGTVSPLHYDPLDNMLIQLVGRKKVVLYPRTEEDKPKFEKTTADDKYEQINWHYAGTSGSQYNTSSVDIENVDYQKYPLFKHAPTPYECIIEPGDVLYIPKKWWHHVRALEVEEDNDTFFSVSVNVWWR